MPNMTEVGVSGSCGVNESALVLSWIRNEANFTLTMEFAIFASLNQWFLTSAKLEFELEENNFENPYGASFKFPVTFFGLFDDLDSL